MEGCGEREGCSGTMVSLNHMAHIKMGTLRAKQLSLGSQNNALNRCYEKNQEHERTSASLAFAGMSNTYHIQYNMQYVYVCNLAISAPRPVFHVRWSGHLLNVASVKKES